MSVEAEMSVLGCMILDGECARVGVDGLDPEMFTHTITRRIFEAMLTRYWSGRSLDAVALTEALPEDRVTLLKLADYTPTTGHFAEYLRIVRDDWRRRELQLALSTLLAEVTVKPVMETVSKLRELAERQEELERAQAFEGVTFTQAARELSEWLKEEAGKNTIFGGFPMLDRATGGFLRKSYTALCARSGGGKTDYAVNLMLRMMKRGYRIVYFSLEMSRLELMQRAASNIVGIDGTRIRDKRLTSEEGQTVNAILEAFDQNDKARFLDEGEFSIREIRHFVDLLSPDVIFIDHIGLMKRDESVRDQYRALGKISNALKRLAKEKNIAVINLVQMNRQIEIRKDKRPTLADIRESGDIEQDADYILCVQPEDTSGKHLVGDAWAESTVYLLKNRNGKIGEFRYHWQPQYHTYREVEINYE